MYAYCGNNPVVYYDPSEYDKVFDWGIIPSVKNGFVEWFDSVDKQDFYEIWQDDYLKRYIQGQTRKPGGFTNGKR